MKCPLLGNELNYEVEVWYFGIEVIYDADVDNASEIKIDHQNRSSLMVSSF